jgi:hypothetical protein
MKQSKQANQANQNTQTSQYEQLWLDTNYEREFVNTVLNDHLESDADTTEELYYTDDYYAGTPIIDSCTLYNLDVRISVEYNIKTMRYSIFMSMVGLVEFSTTNVLSLPIYIAMMMDAHDMNTVKTIN